MSKEEKVSITISIKKKYRDKLRTMAAEKNFDNPNEVTTASTLARKIICEHLNNALIAQQTLNQGGEM